MKAYVICCNGCIEAVVLEDEERAKQELIRLRKEHYENHGRFDRLGYQQSFSSYCQVFYWHIHTVDVLNLKGSPQ